MEYEIVTMIGEGGWVDLEPQEIQRLRAAFRGSRLVVGFSGSMAILGVLAVAAGAVAMVLGAGIEADLSLGVGCILALCGGLMVRLFFSEFQRDCALARGQKKWVIQTILIRCEPRMSPRVQGLWFVLEGLGKFAFVVPVFEQQQLEYHMRTESLPCAVEAHLTMPPQSGCAQLIDLRLLNQSEAAKPSDIASEWGG